ncbi:hypothetical protein [Mycobacterium marinum]|uniref:hypothetical protein n=1 Tax=Mycobacterium marinum TaxID=1781 RepID=UPI003565B154
MATVTAVPTLSAIQAWDTTHLDAAATDWSQRAWQWENAFNAVYEESLRPGGTTWHGVGAEAAASRAGADKIIVAGIADRLHTAARLARDGAEDIAVARQHTLDAITTTESAGFTVTEDLSVIPPPSSGLLHQAQLNTQAQTLAADIRAHATDLLATDTRVAGQITTATADLNTAATFDNHPLTPPPPAPTAPTIHAVDHHNIKQAPAPGTPDDPIGTPQPPGAADIRRILDGLPDGNKPSIKEVRSPEDLQRLWEWAKQNGTEMPDGYQDSGKGTRYRLPDGTTIGQRPIAGSSGRPALDITLPGEGYTKVHVNPRGGVPEIPAIPGQPAPAPAAPRVPPPPVIKPVPAEPPPIEGAPRGIGGAPMPIGPTLVPPPHSIDHLPVLGEDDLAAPWEFEP